VQLFLTIFLKKWVMDVIGGNSYPYPTVCLADNPAHAGRIPEKRFNFRCSVLNEGSDPV
jgi:hypothetical protein